MDGRDGLPCGYHGPGIACDRCPAGYGTDRQGFPHRQDAPELDRRRHCPSCGELVTREQWDTRPTGPFGLSAWRCLQCSNEDAIEPAAAGARVSAAATAKQSPSA